MTDYITTVKPIFPFIETITFKTEVIEYDSLVHASIGTPDIYQTTSNIPEPRFPLKETINRISLVSSDQVENPREIRRVKYEDSVRKYTLEFNGMTVAEKAALATFFINQKGRYKNFTIAYSYLFENVSTLVRFTEDEMSIALEDDRNFKVSIGIEKAQNGIYIPKYNSAYRTFILSYNVEDLSSLINFFEDTSIGRSTLYNFNPNTMAANYLDNTTYVCRFDSDDFDRQFRQQNENIVTVKLREVVNA